MKLILLQTGLDLLDLDDDDLVSMKVLDVELRIRVLKELEMLVSACPASTSVSRLNSLRCSCLTASVS